MEPALEFESLATDFKKSLETRLTLAVVTLEHLKIGLSEPSGTTCDLAIEDVEKIKKFCIEFIRKFTDFGVPGFSITGEGFTGSSPADVMELVGVIAEDARKKMKKFEKTVLALQNWLEEFEKNRHEFKGTPDEFRKKLEDGKTLLGDWPSNLKAMRDDFIVILGFVESGITDAVSGEGVDPGREE